MLPVLYNDNYEIVQTPNAVMILVEMVHDIRVIRLNGTHQPAGVRQLLGDSVGHWEGDTLVVDTTNFTDKTRFRGSSENLHVIERFRASILVRFFTGRPWKTPQLLPSLGPWNIQFAKPRVRFTNMPAMKAITRWKVCSRARALRRACSSKWELTMQRRI